MPVPITALYVAIFAVFSFVLASVPGRMRGGLGISVGDGGNPELLLAMRRHGNFLEYVPILLVMFAVLELNGASAALLHGLGVALFVARVLHAMGLKGDTVANLPRGIGAGGTALITAIAAGNLIYQFVQA